jgi:penicillin-binding protein 1B
MRIWAELMTRIGIHSLIEEPPRGVEMVAIDPDTGLRGEGCRDTISYPFISGGANLGEAPCSQSRSLMDDGVKWFQSLFKGDY